MLECAAMDGFILADLLKTPGGSKIAYRFGCCPKTSIKTENLSFIADNPSYGRVYLLSKYRCLSSVLRLGGIFEVTAITVLCERT